MKRTIGGDTSNPDPAVAAPRAGIHGPFGMCRKLYIQVIIAIVAGALVGYFYPKLGASLKPLGDVFIKGSKMVVAPIIFTTVVCGIAKMGNLKRVANIGIKSLLYFEIVSTIALLLGWGAAATVRPGAGFNISPATLDPHLVAGYVTSAHAQSVMHFLMSIVPPSMFGAFAKGDMLPVLFVAVLFGIALSACQERAKGLMDMIEQSTRVLFGMVNIVMYFAPIAAFGAVGFTIGTYGVGHWASLACCLAPCWSPVCSLSWWCWASSSPLAD